MSPMGFLVYCFINIFFLPENRFICISGPVMVDISSEIHLQATYPTHIDISRAKWIRKTNNTSTDLESLQGGYKCITSYHNKQNVQRVIIANVQGKGEYQVCLNNLRSNKINVFVDGMNVYFNSLSGKFLHVLKVNFISERKTLAQCSFKAQMYNCKSE